MCRQVLIGLFVVYQSLRVDDHHSWAFLWFWIIYKIIYSSLGFVIYQDYFWAFRVPLMQVGLLLFYGCATLFPMAKQYVTNQKSLRTPTLRLTMRSVFTFIMKLFYTEIHTTLELKEYGLTYLLHPPPYLS